MKDLVNKFKLFKIIEVISFVILEIIFVGIITSNKVIQSSIFVDRSVFILCAVTYFTVIVSLLIVLIDVIYIRNLRIESRELEQIAYLDSKTGMPNRTSCNMIFDKYQTKESMKGIGCIVTQISNLPAINREQGKQYGDKLIVDFSLLFEHSAADYGFYGRNGGNEFIVVIEACDMDKIRSFISTLSQAIDSYNSEHIVGKIELRSEYALYDYEDVESFSELLSRAYTKLRQ